MINRQIIIDRQDKILVIKQNQKFESIWKKATAELK